MKPEPYVGITGFTSQRQVRHLLKRCADDAPCKIMFGVLASLRTLKGETVNKANRYPRVEEIEGIFCEHAKALNLIHYHEPPSRDFSLYLHLEHLTLLGGSHLHGFQLNITWPHNYSLSEYRSRHPDKIIVLQINDQCLSGADYNPQKIAEIVQLYYKSGLIDYALLDQSSGTGRKMGRSTAEEYLRVLKERKLGLGIGFAGGLHASNLDDVEKLKLTHWPLSIDAESRIRDEQDRLCLQKATLYLRRAFKLYE